MKKKYKILNITHSGRKGIRGKPVDDWKYDGLIGSVVSLANIDILEDCQQFRPLVLKIHSGNSVYDKWWTSEVLSIEMSDDGYYVVETVNTIYEFEEVA